jgi:predicted outer membrane protein
MKLHLWITSALALGMAAWPTGGPACGAEKPLPDYSFLADALARTTSRITASELALTRAQAKEVRQFARTVLARQKAFHRTITALAVSNGVPPEFNEARGRRPAKARLAAVPEGRFDRAFLEYLTKDIEQGIRLAQRRVAQPGVEVERDLARQVLPMLRQWLQEAKGLLKTVQ